jgi:hypothetical protein
MQTVAGGRGGTSAKEDSQTPGMLSESVRQHTFRLDDGRRIVSLATLTLE